MGEEEGEERFARQDGTLMTQQVDPDPRLLLPRLRLRSRPRVYRFPVMPSKERRERREQKKAVDTKLGDGEREGEEEGNEKFWKVYGEGGGREPERSIL